MPKRLRYMLYRIKHHIPYCYRKPISLNGKVGLTRRYAENHSVY
ncbi:hypothetical protein BGLT_05251 [Caballeronia glathei]|jgi:hypothetical protein|nr:hypothetical protein BGLT_05251 [Caballeronia glathei]